MLHSLLTLSLLFSVHINAADIKTMSAQQLLSIKNAPKAPPIVVLDVRSAEEFADGHIENAINIPHDQIENRLNELSQYKNTLVVVHCRSGRRAQVAESILKANDFSRLHHLKGDFIGWQAAQLPVTKQDD